MTIGGFAKTQTMLLSFASHSTTGPSASAILFATRRASFLHLAASLSSSFSSSAVAATAEKDDGAQQRNDAGKRQQRRPPTIRRRTRGGVSHDAAAVPSLADFMHRAKVLRQYRNFVRLARFVDAKDGGTADNNSAGGCIAALDEVRQSYKVKMKKDMDAIARNMAYSEVRGCDRGIPMPLCRVVFAIGISLVRLSLDRALLTHWFPPVCSGRAQTARNRNDGGIFRW